MKRTLYSLIPLLIFTAATHPAFARLKLYAAAGFSVGNTSVRNSEASDIWFIHGLTDYRVKTGAVTVRPNLSLQLSVPLGKRFFFEPSLMYMQKGFYGYIAEWYGSWKKEFISRGTFHYINAPLLLSFRILQTPKSQLYFGAGINYGFFLGGTIRTQGTESLPLQPEMPAQILNRWELTQPVISVLTNARYLQEHKVRYMELLDVQYRVQVRYDANRCTMGLFFDNSPAGVYANIYKHTYWRFRQPAIGMFLGLRLN